MLELEPEAEVGSWRLEPELDLDLEAGMGAGGGAGAEAVESSEIQPGGPKIRTLGPNGTFGHFPNFKRASGSLSDTGYQNLKMLCSPGRPSHTINVFTRGLPFKMHFKPTLGP